MKKIFTVLIFLLAAQASANPAGRQYSLQEAHVLFNRAASELLKNSEEAELTLNYSFRNSSASDSLVYVTRISRGFNRNGSYQHGYHYICRKDHLERKTFTARYIACGELKYALNYRTNIKKALN